MSFDFSKYREDLRNQLDRQSEGFVGLDGARTIESDDHQVDAIQALIDVLGTERQAMAIIQSCGAGKTILESNILVASQLARAGQEVDAPDVILTTGRSLVYSIRDELESMGLDLGIWGAGERNLDRKVVLATIQAMQGAELSRVLPIDRIPLVIGDEADKFLTPKRKEVIGSFSNALKIGFTATSEWSDGRDVSDLWGEKIHQLSLKEAILSGINVPVLYHLFEAQIDANLSVSDGDYEPKALSAALRGVEIFKSISQIYASLVPLDEVKKYPTLVYVPSVDLVYSTVNEMRKTFESRNIVGWTGESVSSHKLQSDVRAFNNGEIDVLVLCEMGGRGLNLPRARVLIDAYPTMSPNKLEQRHGRVLRKIREGSSLSDTFDKPFAIVAQVVPGRNNFRPYLLPDLLDCWPEVQNNPILGLSSNNLRDLDTERNVGRSLRDELREIMNRLDLSRHNISVNWVENIDIYRELILRNDLPVVDEEGFIYVDGERYANLSVWGTELGIAKSTISRRGSRLSSIKGIGLNGRQWDFYKESDVREVCKDLLEDLPVVDEEGFIYVDGERYANFSAWAEKLVISRITLSSRCVNLFSIKGIGLNGRQYDFYKESDVREVCKDLLEDLPVVDEEGFIYVDGERYTTLYVWATELGIPPTTLSRRCVNLSSIKGIGLNRQQYDFYKESDVREVCKDLLEDLPVADEEGFINVDGERYANISVWATELVIAQSTIRRRISGLSSIKGIGLNGQPCDFYEESDVREACKDLLEDLPIADEEGFIYVDGERYAVSSVWPNILGISKKAIRNRIVNLSSIKGIGLSGRQHDFYKESDVREVCKDLLDS